MKGKVLVAALCLLLVCGVWLLAAGFMPRTDVYITDEFAVSADGSELRFHAGVASSMGFIRGFHDEYSDGIHRLKFLSAWGGFNSSLGAKGEFALRLSPEDTEICIYRGDSGYETVFVKDPETGEWK